VAKRRKPAKRSVRSISHYLQSEIGPYDPSVYAEEDLYCDEVTSVLGAPIDGWTFELVYRVAIDGHGLNVNWAITISARVTADGPTAERRRVERIDICHSEVHRHRFWKSSDPVDDLGKRKRIESLSAGDAATVSRQWDIQMMLVSREWSKRARWWIDG
jgi:hypothetical protein